jgi:hypothetical protein
MMFVVAAIMIAIMLPVLNGVWTATPMLTTNPLAVGNMTSSGSYIAYTSIPNTTGAGFGVLTSNAQLVTAQTTVGTTMASSYGLMVVVLILIAASVILGAIGLFRYFGGQD